MEASRLDWGREQDLARQQEIDVQQQLQEATRLSLGGGERNPETGATQQWQDVNEIPQTAANPATPILPQPPAMCPYTPRPPQTPSMGPATPRPRVERRMLHGETQTEEAEETDWRLYDIKKALRQLHSDNQRLRMLTLRRLHVRWYHAGKEAMERNTEGSWSPWQGYIRSTTDPLYM